MYRVLIERRAERDLDSLPAKVFRHITVSIRSLSNDPRPHGSQKLRGSDNDYRIRIGDYRVLYEINDQAKEIRIFRVKIRGQAYR